MTVTATPMELQIYRGSLLSVEGPIVHSGGEHGGLDERNQTPSLLSHQKVSDVWSGFATLPVQGDAMLCMLR